MITDAAVLNWAAGMRTPALNELFGIVTWGGDTIVVGFLILCAVVFLLHQKDAWLAAGLATATLGGEISTFVLKTLIERVRPPFPMPGFIESSYSFPSGHAMIAVAFYGFLIYTIAQQRRWLRVERVYLYWFLVPLIALIGVSRVYLGVHYPSDVLAGYALGALWLWIGVRVSARLSTTSIPPQ